MKTIYGYYRWSTLEQGNADKSSEDRQRINCEGYAKRNGLTIAHELIDRGASAYTGANISAKGELGKLAEKLRSGAIEPSETGILVEELDRLSRRPPAEMISWLMPLLMSGLTVYVANTNHVITVESVNRDFGSFLSLMSLSFSAFDFSRKQQDRGNGAWAKRRKAAVEDGINLSRHRARKWLEWNPSTRQYDPIADRVSLIEEMFELRLKGWGKSAISKLFNERFAAGEDRYRVWASTEKAPKLWTPSAVARIVQDRAVCGFVQYSRAPRGATHKTPIGDPVKVYPAIISDERFALANERRLVEQLKVQGRGRSVSNLLSRISKCGTCGGAVGALGSSRWRVNKDGSKSQHYFLYCQTAKMKGGACTNERGWPYNPIETAIVDKLLTLAIDDTHFRRDDREGAKLEGEVVRLQRRVIDLTASAQRILRAIGDDDDEIGQEEYQRARQQIKDTKAALQTAQEAFSVAQGKVTPHEHLVRVGEVRTKMESEDAQERYEARTLVKMAFANLIESVTFNERKGFVNVMLVDQQRMFVIDQGKIIEDFDFTKMGAAPGTGKFTTYENATVSIDQDGAHRIVRGDVASVSNDLTTDQQEASAGYARRLKQQKE